MFYYISALHRIVKHTNFKERMFADGAYADAGVRTPKMLDEISASLWQLMDEEPTDDCGQGDLVKEVVPTVSDSDDDESALERGAGTIEPGDEVTRVEESEEDDHPGQEEETAGERQGSEYDSEYEEDLSWEEGEESELSGSRSLASSTSEEEEQSSDENDFVEV